MSEEIKKLEKEIEELKNKYEDMLVKYVGINELYEMKRNENENLYKELEMLRKTIATYERIFEKFDIKANW